MGIKDKKYYRKRYFQLFEIIPRNVFFVVTLNSAKNEKTNIMLSICVFKNE